MAAARNLQEEDSIVICKADKTSIFVILDREDYADKVNDIISDKSKVQEIRAGYTVSSKRKINKFIAVANAEVGGVP